jgi:hypothetical protein
MTAVQCSSKASACRRELSSHNAAQPRGGAHRPLQSRAHESSEGKSTVHSRQSTSQAGTSRSYKAPSCHIEQSHCVGSSSNRSVRGATAANAEASGLGSLLGRQECLARPGRRRGAGGACGGLPGIARSWQGHRQRSLGAALPNPSLKRSTNGRPPGPGLRYAVHFLSPGPGVLPLAPA